MTSTTRTTSAATPLSRSQAAAAAQVAAAAAAARSGGGHLLIAGPPGSGKTTLALDFARAVLRDGRAAVDGAVPDTPVPPAPVDGAGWPLPPPSSSSGADPAAVAVRCLVGAGFAHMRVSAFAPSAPRGSAGGAAAAALAAVASDVGGGGGVVVLDDAHALRRRDQEALLRALERCADACSVVLVCETAATLLPSLRSRCVEVFVGAPAAPEVAAALQRCSATDDAAQAREIAEACGGNATRAFVTAARVAAEARAGVARGPLEHEWEADADRLLARYVGGGNNDDDAAADRWRAAKADIATLVAHGVSPGLLISRMLERATTTTTTTGGDWRALTLEAAESARRAAVAAPNGNPVVHVEGFLAAARASAPPLLPGSDAHVDRRAAAGKHAQSRRGRG